MTLVLRIGVFAVLFQAATGQQRAGATLEGIVVERTTGRPLAGAVVELSGIAAPASGNSEQARDWRVHSFSARTANDGTFRIDGVPPGNAYQLVATHSGGFVPAAYGQTIPDDPWIPLTIASGQRLSGIRFALKELASISGRVVDRKGNPVRRMPIAALQIHYLDGQRALRDGGLDYTGENGEYRIPGLAPGRYAVRLGPVKPSDIVPYVYFPESLEPDRASIIDVGEQTHVGDVNFRFAPTETRNIRGSVIRASDGRPVRDARVFLVPAKASPDSSLASELPATGGEFDLRDVTPGAYQLFAVADDAGTPSSGRMSLNVGRVDLQEIKLPIRPLLDVEGRIRVDNPAFGSGLDLSRVLVGLNAQSRATADLSIHAGLTHESRAQPVAPPIQAAPDSTGTFTVKGVQAWPYFADTAVKLDDARVYLKSIRLGPVDVLMDGQPFELAPSDVLEITLGTDAGELEGRVVDGNGNGMAHAVAVLVPDEPFRVRRDLYRTAQTDASGRFHLKSVAPGSYAVFAWRGADSDAWFFPEFLRPHEGRAVRVTIGPSEAKSVETPLLPKEPL